MRKLPDVCERDVLFFGKYRMKLSFFQNIDCVANHKFIELPWNIRIKLHIVAPQDSIYYLLSTRHPKYISIFPTSPPNYFLIYLLIYFANISHRSNQSLEQQYLNLIKPERLFGCDHLNPKVPTWSFNHFYKQTLINLFQINSFNPFKLIGRNNKIEIIIKI